MNHFHNNIHGWFGFARLYDEQVRQALSPAHFVEVGSWQGASAAYMAVEIINSGKEIKFDCVDTWLGSIEHQDMDIVKQGELYDRFIENMRPVEGHYRALRMTSVEASKLYEDNSLDFVCLDGSHEYEDVRADILSWLPKLRPGATLGGDDFPWPGVKQAVTELLPGYHRTGVYWTYRKP